MSDIKPRTSMERAVLALLERDLPELQGHPERIGGDLPASVGEVHVRIGRVTGGGVNQIQGDTVLDIETYSRDWGTADSLAFDIEALVLGYPHVVEVGDRKVVIDRVAHNTGPQDLPWADVAVARIGSTYTFTARRQ